MKRNVLMFSALAVTAFALASALPTGQRQAAGFTSDDTTVVVRRMYEGLDPDMWGTDASPDGRYITQTHWASGDLAVLDLLTGERRRVTAKPDGWAEDSYATQSKFAPDGKAIAYVWSIGSEYQIRVIDVDGSNERIVLPGDPNSRDWPELHDWSPDGTHLLLTYYERKDGKMLLVDIDDGETRTLIDFPEGHGPSAAGFSPDGRYVAFDMNTELRSAERPRPAGVDLYLISVDGGREVRLLSGPTTDRFLGWSPTGGDIIFHSNRSFTEGVWRLSIREGQAVGDPQLVKGDLWQMKLVGVSQGRLFYGIVTQRQQLYTAGIDLTQGRLTTPAASVEDQPESQVGAAAWSQDGLMLAYATGVSEPGQTPKLVIRSVGGEQAQELPSPFSRVLRLWWGPNRDRLIVSGRAAGDQDWRGLSQVDLNTGVTSRYLNSNGVKRWAALTADRRVAYYSEWNGPGGSPPAHFLKRHDLETGAIEHIAGLDTLLTGLMIVRMTDLSPDERSLAFQSYNRRTEKWTIGVVSVITGEARELAIHDRQTFDPNDPNDRDVVCRMIAWTADGQSIIYARAVTGQLDCTIYRVPAAGGQTEPVGKMPDHRGASLTTDRSRIAFEHGEPRGEIWMMDNIPWGRDSP